MEDSIVVSKKNDKIHNVYKMMFVLPLSLVSIMPAVCPCTNSDPTTASIGIGLIANKKHPASYNA